MELQIKKFNMNKITSDKVVVLIGKRNTGKSYLVKDILYHHKNIPVGQAISGTEAANEFYGSIIPKVFIHEEYTAQIIQNIIKRQKLMVEKLKQNPNMDPRVFLILDDCLYDNSWTKNTDIRSIFMNGRHYKILFLLTMQYALGIPPNLRTNIDYVFILRENYVSNRKRLYEHYAGMFPTFDMFCQVMDQCTENYECLVIDNNAKSNHLVDQVFWYKAPERPDFKCGAREFWEYSDKNFQKNNDSNDSVTSSRIKNKVEVIKNG
tara:strand:- start:11085 stop:11876 length:792 start_codon:yes stop_codon:yes gene_type:complete